MVGPRVISSTDRPFIHTPFVFKDQTLLELFYGVRDSRFNEVNRLAQRFAKAGLARNQFLSALVSDKYYSRISSALARESSVHLAATTLLIGTLLTELSAWAASQPPDQDPTTAQIGQVGWDFAVTSIERCIDAVTVDNTKPLWTLAKVIAEKTVGLVGGEVAKSLFDFAKMLEDIGNIKEIRYVDHRTATKITGTFELFMMSCLVASQTAVAQVRALPKASASSTTLHEPFEAAAKRLMGEAKQVVIDYIYDARRQVEEAVKGEENLLPLYTGISFPSDGFWPDPPMEFEPGA